MACGAVPISTKGKVDATLFSVYPMSTWPAAVRPAVETYCTEKIMLSPGPRVTGSGGVCSVISVVPVRERLVMLARVDPT